MDKRVVVFQLLYKLGEASSLAKEASKYGKDVPNPLSKQKGVLFCHQIMLDINKTADFSLKLLEDMKEDFKGIKKIIRRICFRLFKRIVAISVDVECVRFDPAQIRISIAPVYIPLSAINRIFAGLFVWGNIVALTGVVTKTEGASQTIVRFLDFCTSDECGYSQYVTRNQQGRKCRDCGKKMTEDVSGRLLLKSQTFYVTSSYCKAASIEVEARGHEFFDVKTGDELIIYGEFHGTTLRALSISYTMMTTKSKYEFDCSFKSYLNLLEKLCPNSSNETKRLVFFGVISMISNVPSCFVSTSCRGCESAAIVLSKYLGVPATTPTKNLIAKRGFLTLKQPVIINHAELASTKVSDQILGCVASNSPIICVCRDASKFGFDIGCRIIDIIEENDERTNKSMIIAAKEIFKQVSVNEDASVILSKYAMKSGCDAVTIARSLAALRGSVIAEKVDSLMAVYVCEEKKMAMNGTSLLISTPSPNFVFFAPGDSIIPSYDECLMFDSWAARVEAYLDEMI